MQDDSENPPPAPRISPLAFLRKPMFIFGALFLAWVFFGQALMHMAPHVSQTLPLKTPVAHETPATTPVAPAAVETPTPATLQEKDAQIAELQHRLETLETQVKTLQESPKPAGGGADDTKITAMQASIDAIQQAHSTQAGDAAHLEEVMHKQEEDIAALKTQLADAQTKALNRLALISAFETLKDSVTRGESFTGKLARMNELAKDNESVQSLLIHLTQAPSLPELQSAFEAAVPQALAPENSGGVMHSLQSLIRIRKVGEEQTGTSDEAIIARAEGKINRGIVDGTIKELAALSPHASDAFTLWMAHARAYLLNRDTLAALQLALLQDTPPPAAPAPVLAPVPVPVPTPPPAAAQ